MAPRTMKTNPAFLTEQELVDSFVVRRADLQLVMQAVRENTGPSNQHVLVTGPRGIGKTALVLRVVAEIRRDPELNRHWYPIVFAEESYQVSTPGEFWLEAIFHLARQTDSQEWRAVHTDLLNESDEDRLRERALAQLMDFADAQRKRILLVVENLNMLLGEQLSDNDAWTIRHALLNEPRLMLLASATQRFEEIANHGKAMFELLKTYELRPLNTRECTTLWRALTESEITESRVRPIEILTGGNPRLICIIASFGTRKSLRQLMTDLTHLVDEHTEYFKSYLDGLAASERKVFVSLAEIWEPATAREVAFAARLDVNKTSAFLKRLAERGAVSAIHQPGGKRLYQVAERMYNIYYLMRRRGGPSSRIRAAVNFIAGMYAPEELPPIADELLREACNSRAGERDEYHHAVEMLLSRVTDDESRRRILGTAPPGIGKDTPHLVREGREEGYSPGGKHRETQEELRDSIGQLDQDPTCAISIELAAGFAAAGHGREVLDLIQASPSAPFLEPLIVALQMYLGEPVKAPVEIVEVAKDIVKRIELRRERMATANNGPH
ncbi:MAG: ATP-binding protein [Candidatus Hydrogenedentes bacterium]|nr:ATP-binding protein [Candidatus Hydrogenedentota bacterium]